MTEYLTPCVGEYKKGESVCDGNADAVAPDDRLPCAWQQRCSAFRKYLKRYDKNADVFVEIIEVEVDGETVDQGVAKFGYKAFVDFCDKLVQQPARQRGPVDKRKNGPCLKTQKASKVAKARIATEKRQLLMDVFEFFRSDLAELLEGKTFAVAGGVMAPGKLYVRDRSQTSSYVAIYCREYQGHDPVIIEAKMKTSTLTFDIRLPVGMIALKSVLSKKAWHVLSPEAIEHAKYKTLIRGANKLNMAMLARAIAKLINGGSIALPESR